MHPNNHNALGSVILSCPNYLLSNLYGGEKSIYSFLGNKRGWRYNWWHKNEAELYMYMHIIPNNVRRR